MVPICRSSLKFFLLSIIVRGSLINLLRGTFQLSIPTQNAVGVGNNIVLGPSTIFIKALLNKMNSQKLNQIYQFIVKTLMVNS